MVRQFLQKVQYGSGDPQRGLRRVEGQSGRSGMVGGPSGTSMMGRGSLRVVRNVSEDRLGGLGRVGGPTQRSGSGWGTFPEV